MWWFYFVALPFAAVELLIVRQSASEIIRSRATICVGGVYPVTAHPV